MMTVIMTVSTRASVSSWPIRGSSSKLTGRPFCACQAIFFFAVSSRFREWISTSEDDITTHRSSFNFIGDSRLCCSTDVTVIWAGGRTKPPSDKPKCGWENELCLEQERQGKGFVTVSVFPRGDSRRRFSDIDL